MNYWVRTLRNCPARASNITLRKLMLEIQRQHLILDLLLEHSFAKVAFLCEQLNSSPATIRRDISKLHQQGKLEKIRGGARALNSPKPNPPTQLHGSSFLINKEINASAKRSIAQKAVELCKDGESIIINGGSSTYMMAEFLAARRLKILTNSLYLAHDLTAASDNQITLPGGELYRKQGIILSSFDKDSIQNYHATKMFMGTPGLNDYGVTESDPLLVRAEQKLRRQADSLIILADSSKLGKRSQFICEPLDAINIVITDDRADERYINLLEQKNIEVIVVAYQ